MKKLLGFTNSGLEGEQQWLCLSREDGLRVLVPVHRCNVSAIEEMEDHNDCVILILNGGLRYKLNHSLDSVMKGLGMDVNPK